MTREIKFRAWNDGEMTETFDFPSIHRQHFPSLCEWTDEELHPDVVRMQFTGLEDKNGKEIYEGDIIKMPLGDASEQYLLGVKEDDLERGYEVKLVEDIFFFHTTPCPDNFELLGNKYENPDLLTNN